jgi:diguanylate cyclase (GGDEF)-like protein/PAS domain S-box-containing protein
VALKLATQTYGGGPQDPAGELIASAPVPTALWDAASRLLAASRSFQAFAVSFGIDAGRPTTMASYGLPADPAPGYLTGSNGQVWQVHRAMLERGRSLDMFLDVTGWSRAEAEQSRTIQFLSGLLDATPTPIVVKDDCSRLVLVNEAFCRLVGRPREALLGSIDFDHSPPEEARHFVARDRLVLETGIVDVCEEDHTSCGGERRRLLTRKSRLLLADGRRFVIGIITDVTDLSSYQRQLEVRAREADQLLTEAAAERERAVAEHRLLEDAAAVLPHGFAVADADGRVVLANNAFAQALGAGCRSRLVGQPVDGLAAAALPETALAAWRAAYATGDGCEVELALPSETWLSLRVRRSEDGRTLLSVVDVSGFKRNEAGLRRLALEDPLTGLANRRHIAEAGQAAVEHTRRHGRPLGLLLIDIDRFKRINDSFGHDTGDAVLRHFAQLARTSLRAGDLLARIGGEEFAVLLPDTELAGALALAERLRTQLGSTPMLHRQVLVSFSVSIGVTMLGPATADFDAMLNAADRALYAAKESGRDRVCTAEEPASAA